MTQESLLKFHAYSFSPIQVYAASCTLVIPAFQKRRLARSHAARQARSGIQDSPGIKHGEPGNPQKMEGLNGRSWDGLMWKIMVENPTIKKKKMV